MNTYPLESTPALSTNTRSSLQRRFSLGFLIPVAAALTLTPALLHAGTFKKINIDGSFADWAGVPKLYSDPQEGKDAIDYKDVYVAHDDQYLYVRFTLHQAGQPFSSRNNLFLDADGSSATGFKVNGGQVGSEMLIQNGFGYQEKDGGFNEGGINNLDWLSAGNSSSTDFEVRISRNATYANDGSSVFNSEQIALLLEAETPTFTPIEFAPDAGNGGISYQFDNTPPPFPSGQVNLVSLQSTSWYYSANDGLPPQDWTSIEFDPATSGWKSGTALFGNSSTIPSPYPALSTPFAPGTQHAYLRTDFQWSYDPSGVVVVMDHFLSDGAAIYLNGVEVKRIRLPEGTLSSTTKATGGPASQPLSEKVALPASALVPGLNALSVELYDQAQTDGQFVFGANVFATDAYPTFINTPSLPADQNIREGNEARLTVDVAGSEPIQYQWFKDGSPLANATSRELILPVVSQADAGGYYAEASNGIGTVTRSRTAQITTFAEPVQITNKNLPEDLTLLTGQTASFRVETAGSPPLSFQWYHNTQPISDATNASLTLDAVKSSDAGSYYVIVGNRLATKVQSRTAQLVVSDDQIPPSIVKIFGSATSVTVTFSEPVDSTSAETLANYSVKEGLSLLKAAWGGATSPNTVQLTTAPQSLGSLYTLKVQQVKDRFGNTIANNTEKTFRSTILIDGSFEDWTGAVALDSDAQDTTDSTDWNEVFMANDDEYLYVRIVLHNTATWPTSFFYNNFYFNTDDSHLTGNRSYGNVGAEMLIQGGEGYQEKNGGFNEGAINGLDWAIAPQSSSQEFEFRISRRATYASDGLPVFTGAGVSLVLEAENTSYQMRDLSPNSGSLDYFFVPAILGRIQWAKNEDNTLSLTWNGEATLQYRDSLTDGDWQDDPDPSNPHIISADGTARYYRLFKAD